jgi:hypothetical protein
MGVTVYPQLGALLAARRLSVSALEREIEGRFGLSVDPKTLYRLTQEGPVQRADLEIAGAAAAVLGVGLDDLFRVEATPMDAPTAPERDDLPPAQAARLSELFGMQARRLLTEAERAEVGALVSEYGRRRHERHVSRYAERHGVSHAEARRAVEGELAEAERWWREFEADPARRRAFVRQVRRRRADAAAGADGASPADDPSPARG